jgi:hypothetical protein
MRRRDAEGIDPKGALAFQTAITAGNDLHVTRIAEGLAAVELMRLKYGPAAFLFVISLISERAM